MPEDSGMIDLGKTYSKEDCVAMDPCKDKKPHYPTLYISDIKGLENLPEGEFTFTAKGKVISYTESSRNGKETCSCEIEVHSIKAPGAKLSKPKKDSGDMLDEKISEIESAKEDASEEDESDDYED